MPRCMRKTGFTLHASAKAGSERGRYIAIAHNVKTGLCVLLLALLSSGKVSAHGALAIGVPESVALDGLAMGFSWNKPTPDLASVDALRSCLDLKTAPAKARALCRVVSNFSRQCISIASDPGGAGWGWAVALTIRDAQAKALGSCVPTASRSCVIAATHCDTSP